MLGTFAVLLGMYMFAMLVGNMHLEYDDQRSTGLHVRTLMSVYQVLVVSFMLCLHSIFLFFIGVVQRDSVSFVPVSRKADPIVQMSEQQDWSAEVMPP